MNICGWATAIENGRAFPIPIDADLQVEHDGLRLGTCLAIADRLAKYPNFTMQGMRTDLTPKQRSAVEKYRAARKA